MRQRRLVMFMNSYTQGISGGDACFIELAKRLNHYKKIVITSLLGKRLCESKGLSARYLITTREQYFEKVVFTYIRRIVRALFLKIDISEEDILYSTSDFLPDVIPAFVRKLRKEKVKWIQKIFHLIPLDRPIPHYSQKFSFFFIKRLADLVILDNSLLKKNLIQRGFNIDKLTVIPPGINIKYFRNTKSIGEINYDAVFLGRLHFSKGIFDLLEIWKLVCEQKPNAKLAIIGGGDGQIEKELKGKIKDSNLEYNIDVLGHLEDDEAFGVVKSSKIFAFPSHEEGFGIAVLEAMACGLSVVAWDLPIYEGIYERNILRVPIDSIKQFAETVIKLLDDEELRSNLGSNAQEFVKKYDWSKVVEREKTILKSVL